MIRKLSLFIVISLFIFGSICLARADSGIVAQRDIIVDNAIGGMREGSRIVSPDTYGKKTQIPKVPGNRLSPVTDTRAAAGGPAAGGEAKAGIFTGGVSSGVSTGVNEGAVGFGSPTVETPSGIATGALGGGTGSTGGSETGVESGVGGSGTTESADGSLIDVDASADLSSGSVDAGVSLDTDNTDKILDADLSAGAGETGGVTGSADIVAEDISVDSALPPEITESAISSQTDIGSEVDTSGGTVGSEADIGIEADIEGGAEGDDVANDPADGLPAPGL